MIQGIDISNWQGQVNGSQIKSAGYEVVYIMATEGVGFTSPMLQSQYNECRNAGLKVGFYHFMLPSDNGQAQAQHFYNATQGMTMDCKIVLDCETSSVSGISYSQAQITQVVMDFANEIERLFGHEIMIYGSPYWVDQYLTNAVTKYSYWEADYTSASTPQLTNLWGSNYAGWQWSSTGAVSGCPAGNTDLDKFTNDIFIVKEIPPSVSKDFTGLSGIVLKPAQKSTPTPTPTPAPSPAPAPSGQIVVGSTVEITGGVYGGQGTGAGTTIGSDYLNTPYTVQQVSGNEALIQQLESWVYLKNLKLISGGGSSSGNSSASNGTIVVGSTVKVLNGVYAGASAGVPIPSEIVGQEYKVVQVNGNCALLDSIDSWVDFQYLQLVSGGQYSEFYGLPSYNVGERVEIVGDRYSTGQVIPAWAKNTPYTVQQVNNSDQKVLIQELLSWVNFDGVIPC